MALYGQIGQTKPLRMIFGFRLLAVRLFASLLAKLSGGSSQIPKKKIVDNELFEPNYVTFSDTRDRSMK